MDGIPSGRKASLEWDQRGDAVAYEEVPEEVRELCMDVLMKQPSVYTPLRFRKVDYGNEVVEYIGIFEPDGADIIPPNSHDQNTLVVSVRVEKGKVESARIRSRPLWYRE